MEFGIDQEQHTGIFSRATADKNRVVQCNTEAYKKYVPEQTLSSLFSSRSSFFYDT